MNKCKTCGVVLSDIKQKTNAIYCSKHCQKKYHEVRNKNMTDEIQKGALIPDMVKKYGVSASTIKKICYEAHVFFSINPSGKKRKKYKKRETLTVKLNEFKKPNLSIVQRPTITRHVLQPNGTYIKEPLVV